MGNHSSQQATSTRSVSSTERPPPSPAFDSNAVNGDVRFSSDGKTVFRDSSMNGTAFVLLNQPCSSGVYRWQFVLEDDSGASTCLGVASLPLKPLSPQVDIFTCPLFRICRSYTGQLYDCGKLLDRNVDSFWQSGTSVTFVLDMSAGTLAFSKEESEPMEIFHGITGTVAPLVAFYASFSKRVTLVEFKQLPINPTITSLSVSQSPPPEPPLAMKGKAEMLLQSCDRILDMCFDVDRCEGCLEVSSDSLTLSRSEDMYGGAYCLLSRKISSGVAAWEFTVHTDAGASTLVGVASEGMQMPPNNCSLFLSPYLSIWRSYEGRIYHKGIEMTEQVDSFDWSTDCQSIGVMLDMNEGQLYFIRDGHVLSVVLTGIEGPVYPVVGFYAGMPKCISISQYHEASNSKDMATPEPKRVSFRDSTIVGAVHVTNNGNTLVCHHANSMNSYCVLDDPCSSGVHTWTLAIEQDIGASTCIGLTKKPFDIPASHYHIYESKSMWLYRSYQGELYERGLELTRSLDPFWEPGTVVELSFDADNGTLAISRNGHNYGVVFTEIPAPVSLIVAFYAQMDKKVSLIHYSHNTSADHHAGCHSGLELNDLAYLPSTQPGVYRLNSSIAIDQHASPVPQHCLICRKHPVNTSLQPCGHSATCWADADRLVRSGGMCPRCGAQVVAVFNQF